MYPFPPGLCTLGKGWKIGQHGRSHLKFTPNKPKRGGMVPVRVLISGWIQVERISFVPGRMPAFFRSIGGVLGDRFHPWFTRIVHAGHRV